MIMKQTLAISIIALLELLFALGVICQPRLPRVRVLDHDQPTSSSTGGCANHPMTFTRNGSDYFFDSHEDGRDAWMNLNGRNVRLTLLRSTLVYLNDNYDTTNAIYEYRFGATRIRVTLRYLTDYISPAPASVSLTRGKLRRTFRAFVAPQCDAI